MKISVAQIQQDVDDLLASRAELLGRDLPPGDVMVMIGCALGVRMAGGGA